MPPKRFKFPPVGTRVVVRTRHFYDGKDTIACTIENYDEHFVYLQFKYQSLGDNENSEGRRTLYREAFKSAFVSLFEEIDKNHEE